MDRRDYYPFGMEMPERRWRALNEDAARFGFNGKENDNEVKGEGNQQDYGFRIYDPRVARFLSVDPLTSEYPWYTPYQFAGNTPIGCIDVDGLEPAAVTEKAHEYDGTPYEFGGKKPAMMNGYPDGLDHQTYLEFVGQPSLKAGSSAKNEKKMQLAVVRTLLLSENTKDCGIDCSGLAVTAFNADKEKLTPDLPFTNVIGIKAYFVDWERQGKAKVLSDFVEIKEGDIVMNRTLKHVMVATGQTRTVTAGSGETQKSILEVEVIESPRTGKFVSTNWVRPNTGWTIGRPNRSSDKTEPAEDTQTSPSIVDPSKLDE